MRLIDADALIERTKYSFYDNEKVRIDTVTGTFLAECCSPTIDAVEVVRCKDCAEYRPWLFGDRICGLLGSYYGNTKPDDYCSKGRKR